MDAIRFRLIQAVETKNKNSGLSNSLHNVMPPHPFACQPQNKETPDASTLVFRNQPLGSEPDLSSDSQIMLTQRIRRIKREMNSAVSMSSRVSHSCPIPSEVTIDERVECNSSQTSTLALRNASSSLSLSQPIPPLVKHTKSVQEKSVRCNSSSLFPTVTAWLSVFSLLFALIALIVCVIWKSDGNGKVLDRDQNLISPSIETLFTAMNSSGTIDRMVHIVNNQVQQTFLTVTSNLSANAMSNAHRVLTLESQQDQLRLKIENHVLHLNQHNHSIHQLFNDLSTVDHQFISFTGRVDSAEVKIGEMDGSLELILSRINMLDIIFASHQAQIDSHEYTISGVSTHVVSLQTKSSFFEKEIKLHQNSISALFSLLEAEKVLFNQTTSVLESTKTRILEMQSWYNLLTRNLSMISSRVDYVSSVLREGFDALNALFETQESRLSFQTSWIKLLNRSMVSLTNVLEEKGVRIQDLNITLEDMRNELTVRENKNGILLSYFNDSMLAFDIALKSSEIRLQNLNTSLIALQRDRLETENKILYLHSHLVDIDLKAEHIKRDIYLLNSSFPLLSLRVFAIEDYFSLLNASIFSIRPRLVATEQDVSTMNASLVVLGNRVGWSESVLLRLNDSMSETFIRLDRHASIMRGINASLVVLGHRVDWSESVLSRLNDSMNETFIRLDRHASIMQGINASLVVLGHRVGWSEGYLMKVNQTIVNLQHNITEINREMRLLNESLSEYAEYLQKTSSRVDTLSMLHTSLFDNFIVQSLQIQRMNHSVQNLIDYRYRVDELLLKVNASGSSILIQAALSVDATTIFGDHVWIRHGKNLTVGGSQQVLGKMWLEDHVSIRNGKSLNVGGSLSVNQLSFFHGNVVIAAGKSLSIGGSLFVAEETTLKGHVSISCEKNLSVSGALHVLQSAYFDQNVRIEHGKRLFAGGSLDVFGKSQFRDHVRVTRDGSVSVASSLRIGGLKVDSTDAWKLSNASSQNSWVSITYGNGIFVAIANASEETDDRVMTSHDGINWVSHTTPELNMWSSVTFGRGVFVAVSLDGNNRVMISSDGRHWQTRPVSVGRWISVAYGNETFIAVAKEGTPRTMKSNDAGINWTYDEGEDWMVDLSNFIQISAGLEHTCAVVTTGGVLCWGSNGHLQQGVGSVMARTTPTSVVGLSSGINKTSAGAYHTCAVTTSGGALCWGSNGNGRLGDGTTATRSAPTSVSGLSSGVAMISAGVSHTCAVTTGGSALCWGSNGNGRLGDGTTASRTVPTIVSGLSSGVAMISAGWDHTCAVTTSGGAFCWGWNGNGRLGDGTLIERNVSTSVFGLSSGVAMISAGREHTCAVTTSGGALCWGWNGSGRLGDGSSTQRTIPTSVSGLSSGVAMISVGRDHTCAVTTGGSALCWGANEIGRLGDGMIWSRSVPTIVSGLSSGVVMISAGQWHTCAITEARNALCWGWNEYGQIGDGSVTERTVPVNKTGLSNAAASISVFTHHTCAVTTSGGALCWGWNVYAQLGDATMMTKNDPISVSGLSSGVAMISAGRSHTCAVTTSGGALCWGSNGNGRLGDGTTATRSAPTSVSGLSSGVAMISAGWGHTCAVTTSGGAFCWGWNGNGRLGDGTTASRTVPTIVSGLSSGVAMISAGWGHTCAVTTSGGAFCWGWNGNGRLGDGTLIERNVSTSVFGLSSGVAMISAGREHTCAVTTSGGALCWGWNGSGRLGDGSSTQRIIPTSVSGLSSGVAMISAGGSHTCAVTTGGSALCWGWNGNGRLGDGTITSRTVPTMVSGLSSGVVMISTGELHSCAVKTSGDIFCWGRNDEIHVEGGSSLWRIFPIILPFTIRADVSSVVYGTNTIVVCADRGLFLSTDGISWSSRIVPEFNFFQSVAFGKQRFVAVSSDGLHRVIVSNDGGRTWSAHLSPLGTWKYISFVEDRFIALADAGDSQIMSSLDGLDWIVEPTPAKYAWRGVTSQNGRIVAIASIGEQRIMTFDVRSDGRFSLQRLFTPSSSMEACTQGEVAWDEEFIYMCGKQSIVEPAGKTWTVHDAAESNAWRSVTYGDGKFVAVGSDGNHRVMVSMDQGRTWMVIQGIQGNEWTAVTYGNGMFVAVAQNGAHRVMTSPNGLDWTMQVAPNSTWQSVTFGNGMFVAVSSSLGSHLIMTSVDDGNTWILSPWNVAHVSAGEHHTCAVTTSGSALCWGLNSHGQLGDGTWSDSNVPTSVSGLSSGVATISAGGRHTCAVTTSGGALCWGRNSHGQLGDATRTQRNVPTSASGLSSGVAMISVGVWHTCAVTTSGGALCWGANWDGRLGDGTTMDRTVPTNVTGLSIGVATISAGDRHTCALTTSGGALCWGNGGSGRLGDGTLTNKNVPTSVSGLSSGVAIISAGWAHTCAVTTSGGALCWGLNGHGRLGDGTTTDKNVPTNVTGPSSGVAMISAGYEHTCAVTTSGGALCWGSNDEGRLGDGTTTQRNVPTSVLGLPIGVAMISAGWFHTCAVTKSSGALCWGSNDEGRLGDGTTTQRNVPTNVTGLSFGDDSFLSLSSITFSDIGLFVAVAFSGTNRILTSSNGILWNPRIVPQFNPWQSVTYGNGKFVAVSSSGTNRVMTSSDGVSWELAPSAVPSSSWTSVAYGNNLFVAVASSLGDVDVIIVSEDGITWNVPLWNDFKEYSISHRNQWKSITFGSNTFVAVSEAGPLRVLRSAQDVRKWKRSRLSSW